MRSSRSSRWASANWIRSCGVSGGSSPAWSRRYWFTQLPSVPSFTPSSRATWAIGRDPSITNRTASSRNSGLNLRYFLAIPCITFRARSYWITVREQRGTSPVGRVRPVLTVVPGVGDGADDPRPAGVALIDELVREGARRMLAEALQAEVEDYITRHVGERDEHGRRLVVRNGTHQPREVLTSAG